MKNERNKKDITEAIFETDGLCMCFEASVVSCEKNDDSNNYLLVLDRTAFFPEGGGQKSDIGTINDVNVLDVQTSEDGRIIHYVDKPITVGTKVEGCIDEALRMAKMQNHSAEHLLCGIIHNIYGYDNVGFHMDENSVVLDVDGEISKEQLLEVEREANKAIYKNVPITISFPTEDEAKSLEYRSKLDTYDNIRLVTIEGYDVCACCAPHLSTTGQIGLIKVIDSMPHRQGTRITMIAGIRAYEDYLMIHKSNDAIVAMLSSKREKTAEFVNDLLIRNAKLREENTSLKKEVTKIVTATILQKLKNRNKEDKSPEMIFTSLLDNVGLRNLINECEAEYDGVIIGFIGDDDEGYRYICATSGGEDILALTKKLNERFGGKGGGSSQMVQGSIKGLRHDIEDFLIKEYALF